jgi:hypothetical protein
MKTTTNYQHTAPRELCAWLPTEGRKSRALDVSRWRSRAGRGHSWNAGAAMRITQNLTRTHA